MGNLHLAEPQTLSIEIAAKSQGKFSLVEKEIEMLVMILFYKSAPRNKLLLEKLFPVSKENARNVVF